MMTAKEIIRKHYLMPNPMTPRVINCGAIVKGAIAYELSWGVGMKGTIYGLSVVRLRPDGTTRALPRLSGMHRSQREAITAIRQYRSRFRSMRLTFSGGSTA